MKKQKKLTQAQKDLLRGLKIFRVDEECIIVIMLMTQKAFQTEMMIDYMISHEKATQEELLSKAMEISSGLKIGSPNFFFNSMPSSYARRLMTTPKNADSQSIFVILRPLLCVSFPAG